MKEEKEVKEVKGKKEEKTNQVLEARKIKKKSEKFHDANLRIKRLRKILVIMLLMLLIIYFILKVVYDTGRFTITLDTSSDMKGSMVMYESKDNKLTRRKLQADAKDFMTNISGDWIPANINDEADGGHNGDNYIAYTFYLENEGDETIHYWYRIIIDDIIRNVDEALRIAVYINGEKTVYAKRNSTTHAPEKDTIAFQDDETAVLAQRRDFKSGDVDKCTIVIWIEGDDPDCIDDLIGGELKMHMTVTEEHIKQE